MYVHTLTNCWSTISKLSACYICTCISTIHHLPAINWLIYRSMLPAVHMIPLSYKPSQYLVNYKGFNRRHAATSNVTTGYVAPSQPLLHMISWPFLLTNVPLLFFLKVKNSLSCFTNQKFNLQIIDVFPRKKTESLLMQSNKVCGLITLHFNLSPKMFPGLSLQLLCNTCAWHFTWTQSTCCEMESWTIFSQLYPSSCDIWKAHLWYNITEYKHSRRKTS